MHFLRSVQDRDPTAACRVVRLRARHDFDCDGQPVIPAWLGDEFRPHRHIQAVDTFGVAQHPNAIGIGVSIADGTDQADHVRVDVDPAGNVIAVARYAYQ